MEQFVNPTGVPALSSIFLGIVRLVLIICLLGADPVSQGFGNICIILCCVAVARHLLLYFTEPATDNIYTFLLDLITPCLYGFLLYHILSIYESDLLVLLVSLFLPAFMYTFLFAREPGQGMSKRTLWGGIFGYLLSLLLVLNYSFDRSRPVLDQYFLAKKFSAITGSDAAGDKGESFHFNLIHIDSISPSANWVAIDQKACQYYHNSWMYKMYKLENETYMVLDKKTYSNHMHQCSLLLQKINGPVQSRVTTELQYAQFEKGDTFSIEKHKGVLGITWMTYY